MFCMLMCGVLTLSGAGNNIKNNAAGKGVKRMFFVKKMLEEVSRTDYPLTREADFDDFWSKAVKAVEAHDPRLEIKEAENVPYRYLKVYDLTAYALDGTALKAWLYVPAEASEKNKLPGAIFFHGGNGSRGDQPMGGTNYALCGCVVLQTEFRLQGGVTSSNTPMQRGILKGSWATNNLHSPNPADNYFYHAFTDQLIWTKLMFKLGMVNPQKVAVFGASQGGGTSLIMAALEPRIALCMPSVPSYCCWERRIFTRTASGGDIAKYIERFPEKMEQVFRVMSYFDALNMADKIKCPVKMQVSLRDAAAPADCAFAAYNKITAPKSVKVNCFGEHGDVDLWQWLQDLKEFCK